MFGFLNKQKEQSTGTGHYLLALDIGIDSVKAMIFEAKGSKGVVLGYGECKQNLYDMHHGAITDIGSVIANCKEAIAEAEKQAGKIPSQMIIGLAGDLIKGATQVAVYDRDEPELKIDLAELKNIVHKLQWRCFEDARGKIAEETGYNEIEIKLVNAAITSIEIDGYRVENPVGFQGRQVKVKIFNAFAPLVHFGALQTIAAELDLELLAITSEAHAIGQLLANELPNAVMVDVGGGTTDISLINEQTVVGTKVFMMGGQTLTKRLAHLLNVSYEDAEQIKLAYSEDHLERQSYKVVRQELRKDVALWRSGVELALGDLAGASELPTQVFLVGGSALLPEVKESLENEAWQQRLNFAARPQFNFYLPKDITNFEDRTKKLQNSEHIPVMALANSALMLAGGEQVVTTLLRKVVSLMQAE